MFVLWIDIVLETSDCEMEVEPEQLPPPPILDEDEDMIPPTPGRKRVRKQIDKVSMDEDGFISKYSV